MSGAGQPQRLKWNLRGEESVPLGASISEWGIPLLAEGARQEGNPDMFNAKRSYQAWLAVLAAVALITAKPVTCGQAPSPVKARSSLGYGPQLNPGEVEPPAPSLPAKQKRDLLKYNFNQMKKDVQELAKLAKSLQEDVDHSNENVLSLDVVSKAERIEKLAKKIKDAAKGLPNRAGRFMETGAAAAR